jgi:hypothetical protein
MNIYDWNEIKQKGDCIDFCTKVLGMKEVTKNHYNCPWRAGSDSKSFQVWKDGWKDYVANESGSILDLCARSKFPDGGEGDLWAAQEYMGEMLGLKPSTKAKTRAKKIAEYIYTNVKGDPIHKTIRFEPKDFVQYRFEDGDWKPGMGSVIPVLYRLPEWVDKKWVVVAEGEKDCDNLAKIGIHATTNAMGAENWKDHYNDYFKGKKVVIFPDNDDKGRAHAQLVSWNLKDHASEIRIVELPELPPKGDVSDYIFASELTEEGIKAKLLEFVKNATKVTQFKQPEKSASAKKDNTIKERAKEANHESFKNYRLVDKEESTGRRTVREPIHINELMSDVFKRFLDFPRRVGFLLFDHDRKTGEIRTFENAGELFSWIQEKSGHSVQWAKIEGAVSQEQLFNTIRANAQRYETISGVPSWPTRTDVYYTYGEMPAPTSDAKYFKKFCSFFSPSSETDAAMVASFFASPLYYRQKCDRPLWIIDSTSGQGSGKTKLAEMLAYLYGGDDIEQGEPVVVDAGQIGNEQAIESIRRRLMSKSGRKKRIFLLDNVCGFFQSPALASMITQGSLSGIAPYGRGEETRPNDLTYVITSNSATVNRDLSARAFIIMLQKPEEYMANWERTVQDYIRAHRLQIISDIIGILEAGAKYTFTKSTRFRMWEQEVLAAICGTKEIYEAVIALNEQRKLESDGEKEEADTIRQTIKNNITEALLNPDKDIIFITNSILRAWTQEAIPGFGGKTGKAIPHILRNWAKTKTIPELSDIITRFPDRNGQRGLAWNCPGLLYGYDKSKIHMIAGSNEGQND